MSPISTGLHSGWVFFNSGLQGAIVFCRRGPDLTCNQNKILSKSLSKKVETVVYDLLEDQRQQLLKEKVRQQLELLQSSKTSF